MPKPTISDLNPGVIHITEPIRIAKRMKIFNGPAKYPIVAQPIIATPIVAVKKEVKMACHGPRKRRDVL